MKGEGHHLATRSATLSRKFLRGTHASINQMPPRFIEEGSGTTGFRRTCEESIQAAKKLVCLGAVEPILMGTIRVADTDSEGGGPLALTSLMTRPS
jgi:hypothetical protein